MTPVQEDGLRQLAGRVGAIAPHSITRPCLVALLLLIALIPGSSEATTWSAVDDFSTTTNTETSTWSYRVKAGIADGPYTLLSVFTSVGNPWVNPYNGQPGPGYWSNGVSYPAIGVNKTGGSLTDCYGCSGGYGGSEWLNNSLWLSVIPRPVWGPEGGLVAVSWLSPADMTVTIDAHFMGVAPPCAGSLGAPCADVVWGIDKNGVGELNRGLAFNGTGLMHLTTSVAAGDRINFYAGQGYYGGTAALTATISSDWTLPAPVPEPGTLLTLATGFAGLGGAWRWRHRAGGRPE